MTDKQLEDMTLDELRAEAEKAGTVDDDQVVGDPLDDSDDGQDDDAVIEDGASEPEETLEQVRARLASAEKALHDTKAWGTRKAQEAADLRRAQEAAAREAQRPAILDANPDLAEAIRFVREDDGARQRTEQELAMQEWQDTVRAAVPDIDELLENNDFHAAMKVRAQHPEWNSNPLIAIREINAEIRARAAFGAQQAAKEAEAEKKRSATSLPSGGAKQVLKPAPAEEEQLRKYQKMSSEDFAREVRKVSLGL